MNKDQIKIVAGSALLTASVVLSAIEYRKVVKQERIKRAQIEEDYRLDIQAIKRAGDITSARIASGPIRPLHVMLQDLDTEIQFQKIAIRNEE